MADSSEHDQLLYPIASVLLIKKVCFCFATEIPRFVEMRAPHALYPPPHTPPPPALLFTVKEHEASTSTECEADTASTYGSIKSSKHHAQRTLLRARLALAAFRAEWRDWSTAGREGRILAMGTRPGL